MHKLHAEQHLHKQAQQPEEAFPSYTEDVLYLCRRVNPTMTEDDKIKHILMGIEDSAFQMSLAKTQPVYQFSSTYARALTNCTTNDLLTAKTTRNPIPSPALQSQTANWTTALYLITILPMRRSPSSFCCCPGDARPTITTTHPPALVTATVLCHPPALPLSYAAVVAHEPPVSFSVLPHQATIPIHIVPSLQFYIGRLVCGVPKTTALSV